MTLTVYGDFTDPLSYVASIRADALRTAGVDLEWRAVAAHRSTRILAEPVGPEAARRIADVERWRREEALPGEPTTWLTPRTTPWSDPPVSAYAEAVGAGVADHVRHLLFAGYWLDGLDIGNPDVLRPLLVLPILHGRSASEVLAQEGYAVAIGGGPVTTAAWRRVDLWRHAWHDLGREELPVLVEDSTRLAGRDAVAHLGSLVEERRLDFPPANPYRLPPMPLSAQRVGLGRPGRRAAWWDADPTLPSGRNLR